MGSHLRDDRFYDLFQPKQKIVYIERVVTFSKEDDEHLDNGVYLIKNQTYMSVWAYKKGFEHFDENDSKANGEDSSRIKSTLNIKDFFKCTPDLEGYNDVYIFKVADLDEYFMKE